MEATESVASFFVLKEKGLTLAENLEHINQAYHGLK